ncbi:uncharacterized protein LOC100900439 [Galendromus occidentalis]|uniref:Uncharacterized protein LOC100900439 n=1 Tax=Galendromus occidentalis TaxID=34638 RepID=A0AAJ6QQ68_9ACAR|nr:uncharacterized protein LOC100900439 [Galendromus occidentalis]
MAKVKVAPIKAKFDTQTRVLGAVLAARLLTALRHHLGFPIHSHHLYCDNASVIGWMRSDAEKWKPYVANRIRRIRSLIGDATFNYVKSEDNPADLITRRSSDLADPKQASLWTQGPSWLKNPQEIPFRVELNLRSGDTPTAVERERKATPTISSCFLSSAAKGQEPIFFENLFSSWLKTIRFWAFMKRIKTKAQDAKARLLKGSPSPRALSAEDRNAKTYSPFMDEQGFIRCRTRLTQSDQLTDNQKFPIILPPGGGLCKQIIRYTHERKCFHSGGVAATLHELRKDFLILHARKLTRQVISECTTCKIFRAEAASLPMATLPKFRIEQANPFQHAGCDFSGPYRYKKDSGETGKAYILLFDCCVSRAVHLQLTTDLSTVEVLGALQKFINRYPFVETINSDNGLSFQRASKEIRAIYEHIRDGSIKKLLAENFITWTFHTPLSPQSGGHFERLIGCVKKPLRRILGTAIPHFRDLEIILTGVEAMVNRRPLTPVATGPDDVEALCPFDLIYGRRGRTFMPQHDLTPHTKADEGRSIFQKRYQYQQRLLNAFWKRYQGEYLQFLSTAHKRFPRKTKPLEIGDICLLEDTANNRAVWPLCKVIAFPDNVPAAESRSCTVRTARGQTLIRPIRILYPITESTLG